jgi:hypothetical protein
MSLLAEFLAPVLRDGQAIFRSRPDSAVGQDAEAVHLLREAYAHYHLRVVGPPIDFDPPAALTAAALVHNACWFLLSRDEPEAELERLLTLSAAPCSAAEHLSADLLLRFLPHIHRRARAHDPADRLTTLLANILRRWPLSGVLSDVEDGPLTLAAFDDHPGLLMLYAERLAQHEKPAWVPRGLGLDYLELVYHELGKDPARLLPIRKQAATHEADGEGEETDE